MTEEWPAKETNTHQDHVIAHVIGAPLSVVIGGLGSLVSAAVAAIKAKSLLNYEGSDNT